VSLKNRGNFENPQLLNARARRATSESCGRATANATVGLLQSQECGPNPCKDGCMATDPSNWHQALACVTGAHVHGEQRITTHELLTSHLGVPVTDQNARRLRRVMRELGWLGPRRMRWGGRTTNGYWRYPTAGPPAVVRGEPAEASVEQNTLASELEAVTQLGLQKLDHILRLPTDPSNGNILRAQTAAAATAVNAQLRADETKMKQVQKGDMLAQLIEIMEVERVKLMEFDRANLEKEQHKTLPEEK
jgi:hypothetical protein